MDRLQRIVQGTGLNAVFRTKLLPLLLMLQSWLMAGASNTIAAANLWYPWRTFLDQAQQGSDA